MKLFSIKTMLGMAAIGGAAMYVRKQGGLQKTFDNLMGKKDELLAKSGLDEVLPSSKRSRNTMEPVEAKTL
jgi:hypothetical protein